MNKRPSLRLIPSLREKKRYLAFEVISQKPVASALVSSTVNQAFVSLHGELGAASAGIHIPAALVQNKRGIIRVNHASLDLARASLCMVQRIGAEPCVVRSVGASGSLKKAKRYLAA
ncbi:ribonuclease P [Candidatus Woesearchaeota archaeon]|nr:ribonuclease P [Candidatus Woesearchaeota archaeon]